jgi:UDP-GlcNAc:undecaprenyl-phosphate GlcNAc-1-phosphate transferase
MDKNLLVAGLAAFASASLLLWILEPVARHIGLVDHPGGRKTHSEPTPMVGGIAMFIALTFSVLTLPVPLSNYRLLIAGALILVVVGVLDDFRELSARQRFGAQIVVGLMMSLGAGVVLSDLGYLIEPSKVFGLGVLAIPLSVFATVGVINAVNMSDGVDGLAGSLVLVAVGALCVITWVGGQPQLTAFLVLLAGVLLAFLMFNLRLNGSALVFMGDAGSMFLGFVLAWFLIELSQGEDRLLAPVTALWILALPLIDTVSMMVRRIRLGRSPFLADREHLHHILTAAGFTSKQTVLLMFLVALTTAGIGVVAHLLGVAEHWMFLGFIALFSLHHWAVMRAWRIKRFLRRPLIQHAESEA